MIQEGCILGALCMTHRQLNRSQGPLCSWAAQNLLLSSLPLLWLWGVAICLASFSSPRLMKLVYLQTFRSLLSPFWSKCFNLPCNCLPGLLQVWQVQCRARNKLWCMGFSRSLWSKSSVHNLSPTLPAHLLNDFYIKTFTFLPYFFLVKFHRECQPI